MEGRRTPEAPTNGGDPHEPDPSRSGIPDFPLSDVPQKLREKLVPYLAEQAEQRIEDAKQEVSENWDRLSAIEQEALASLRKGLSRVTPKRGPRPDGDKTID